MQIRILTSPGARRVDAQQRLQEETRKFAVFLIPYWLSVEPTRTERTEFLNAIWLLQFDRFPLDDPPKDSKKCHRLVTEQKRWFAEMLFMEATIRPETPFSGDWRVALTLPADRIRRRNEWVARNQGPPVDHQYIVAFEDDEDPDDLCEWFDESRFDVD